jgi:hypothetical protein
MTHLATARPPFSPVQIWPSGMQLPREFVETGPTAGELGLESPVNASGRTIVPVRWCVFRAGESNLMLFADDRIPLNVGISHVGTGALIRGVLREKTVATVATL